VFPSGGVDRNLRGYVRVAVAGPDGGWWGVVEFEGSMKVLRYLNAHVCQYLSLDMVSKDVIELTRGEALILSHA
jgi:hypothetical protein